ncbi:MAG: hypothetical protein RI955_1387 [Bacteroidota bacterium]|jgi:hypothetical protein
MAPTIFYYQGLEIKFHSNEHEPVHVHIIYNEFESVIEFEIDNGKIVSFIWRKQLLAKELPESQKKHALKLIRKYKKEILQSWIDYFVLHKKIKAKRISQKL